MKFQELKAKRESGTVPELELEIKQLKDKILGVTNEKENMRQLLNDLQNDIKIIREERDRYYKIVKGTKPF
ncbi:MAG: hypothetical protein ACFFC3_01255 [Candidatus Odinarchaeota archaeon]